MVSYPISVAQKQCVNVNLTILYVNLIIIIIHCSIFLHSHWLRAYDEFFVFCWWREHMTNNYRICHVLTPSETNTRFICHVFTPSELFVNVYNVQISFTTYRFRTDFA